MSRHPKATHPKEEKCMAVDRLLPTQEAADLITLARDVADKVLAPIVDVNEKAETYPEGVFAALGVGRGRAAFGNLSCHPLLEFGIDEQKQRGLPGTLSGSQIGAYSLSEPQAGSDAAALRCAAVRTDDGGYVINGSKSWITSRLARPRKGGGGAEVR